MRSRRAQTSPADAEQRLSARIGDLEQRIRMLEAHLRRLSAEEQKPARGRKPAPPARPRPRCPGCKLELPKGRRGDACVWCGFIFDALPARKGALGRASKG